MLHCEDLIYGYERAPRYRAHCAFDRGSFTTITGVNGSGKTTLLHALAGLVPMQGGRILCGDRDITQAPLENRGVYLVFTHGNLFPGLSVQENLHVVPGVDAARARWLLGDYGVENLRTRYPHELSSGQQQLISLLRVQCVPHPVILLDEPLNYLSVCIAQQVRASLVDLAARQEKTVIMVAHQRNLETPAPIERCVPVDKLVECL